MIRTVITPQKSTYSLAIPPHYIGKTVEILLYSNEDFAEYNAPEKQNLSDFFGTLGVGESEKFQMYVQNSRTEIN